MVEKKNNNKKTTFIVVFTTSRIEKQAAEIRPNLNLIEQLQDSAFTCVPYVIHEVLTIIALCRTHRSLLLQVVKQPIDKFSKPKIKDVRAKIFLR